MSTFFAARMSRWLPALLLASSLSSCVFIHRIDEGFQRNALGSNCDVPINHGAEVPSGWDIIGELYIDGAGDWAEGDLINEARLAACALGAEYVVTYDTNKESIRTLFLARSAPTASADAEQSGQ